MTTAYLTFDLGKNYWYKTFLTVKLSFILFDEKFQNLINSDTMSDFDQTGHLTEQSNGAGD